MMNSASMDIADRMRDVVERQDETAFKWLVERYLPVVLGAAMRRCNGDRMLAQDVTQDVFIRFAERLPRLRSDERIGAWLHRAATFRAGDVMRSEQRRTRREDVAAERLALDQLPESDRWEQLAPELDAALASLRANDRELIVQHYLEGQSVERLSTMRNVKIATLRKRLQRALSRLRQRLLDKQLVMTTTSLATVLTSQLSSDAAALPAGFAETITAEAISATSSSPTLPLLAFPFLRDMGFGAMGAFAIGAITLLLPQETQHPETSSPGFSRALSRDKPLATIPQFTYASRPRSPETLEDIMAAIGDMLAKPMSSLDRQRATSLAQRIPEDQAGYAMSLIDTTWSEVMRLRMEHYQFGGGSHHQPNRQKLFTQWAVYDPESALTWVLPHAANDSLHWKSEIESAFKSWSNEDLNAALRWVEQHILGNAQEISPNLARPVAKGIGSAIYLRDGAIAATKFMVRLDANWMRSGFVQYIFDPFESFKSGQDFTQAMNVMDEHMKSPRKRQSARYRALLSWRKVDWDSAFNWLQHIPTTGYHADLAWELGFPEALPPGFTYEAHAEWLEALPKPADSKGSRAFYPVINQWLPKDPHSASEWLFAKGYVNKGNVDTLLGQLPHSQEHANITEEIIAKARQQFPESVEGYVRTTRDVFLHPALKELKEAQP
jgi:RNA polymerase sigma factor (sigma-70 family)